MKLCTPESIVDRMLELNLGGGKCNVIEWIEYQGWKRRGIFEEGGFDAKELAVLVTKQ